MARKDTAGDELTKWTSQYNSISATIKQLKQDIEAESDSEESDLLKNTLGEMKQKRRNVINKMRNISE